MLTLDDLWRVAYFTGHEVVLQVVGGHETVHRVKHDGLIYVIPADTDELLATIDAARNLCVTQRAPDEP